MGASSPDVSFRRYVDPSDSRQPSTVRGDGFLTGAIDPGAAVDDATALGVGLFTGVELGDFFSIAGEAVCGLATSDVEDRSLAAVPGVFEARFAVRVGSCDEVAASTAAPALARSGEAAG